MPLNSCSIRQLSVCRTGFRQFQFQRSFSPCRRNKLAANSKACLFFFPLSMESIKSTEFLCLWWHYRIRLNKMCESAMRPRGLLWLLVLTWHKLVEGRHHYRAIISCCAIILRCVPAWLKWAYTAGRSALYRYLTGSGPIGAHRELSDSVSAASSEGVSWGRWAVRHPPRRIR